MKKNICKLFLVVLSLCAFSMSTFAGKWIELGRGYRFRVDPPHVDNIKTYKWHVHVEKKSKGGGKWSESVDGTPSHGSDLSDSDDSDDGHGGSRHLPNDIKEKVRNHPETERARDKEDERQANFRRMERIEKLMKCEAWLVDNAEKIKDAVDKGAKTLLVGAGIGAAVYTISEIVETIGILGLAIL